MSRFFSRKHEALEAYVPGEQPRDQQYVKLNTNESPYPPSPGVAARMAQARPLNLYCDIPCTGLRERMAERLDVAPENLLFSNGSDEALNFVFMAYGDAEHPFVFPDITYGFYTVFGALNNVPYRQIPLGADFSIDPADYCHAGANVLLANPNAPTGMALSPSQIEPVVQSNPDHVVVIDEAYVDFGAESCVPLTKIYDNLLVVQTFSKSRSLAGARLGFAVGNRALIDDLNTIKYSTNPYNVNSLTQAAGEAALDEDDYYRANCQKIIRTRENTRTALEALGFTVLPSQANFLFARHPAVSGQRLYERLKARGVLVRHFTQPAIADYNRITIGTPEQMDILLEQTKQILQQGEEQP